MQMADVGVLVHCVAQDLAMTDGIASKIKEMFIPKEEMEGLKKMNKKVGSALLQKRKPKDIIHLVTKVESGPSRP